MAWEKRKNRLYYYRAHREGNRVVKTYFGGGEKGRQAAAEDEAARQARDAKVRSQREQQRPLETLVAELDELGRMMDRITIGNLLSAGWKCHQRHWRPTHDRNRNNNRGS